ncbi:hypothetical protein BFJ63_vAg14388 [Fusarium oxysporum f. sp. narcissi]|uniref:Aminoglycoside phosphotransferase domain-containing protein n=1 Tax=Fusarium oxysporum f. sp. narcissi TaxID=451672 RepID=A0A4Q2V7F2_FUSOX|nr:hypothetical protein BFJ63_vAg14388 [Fusarium oxysporum f. sp. narcissi]
MAKEITDLCAQINYRAVCELASSLDSGKICSIEHLSEFAWSGALTGCANYHARIRFDDKSATWLLRVPRIMGFAVGFPVHLAEYLIHSEFATLKFLETVGVPVPRAFSISITTQGTYRGIGICFLLKEELTEGPWGVEAVLVGMDGN